MPLCIHEKWRCMINSALHLEIYQKTQRWCWRGFSLDIINLELFIPHGCGSLVHCFQTFVASITNRHTIRRKNCYTQPFNGLLSGTTLLPPSTTIRSILFVQFTCLTVLFHNRSPGRLVFDHLLHTPGTSSPCHLFATHALTIAACSAVILQYSYWSKSVNNLNMHNWLHNFFSKLKSFPVTNSTLSLTTEHKEKL